MCVHAYMCGYVVMWCGVLVMESMPYCVLTSMISNINIVYQTTQNLVGIKFKLNYRFWISMSGKVGILAMVIFCAQKLSFYFIFVSATILIYLYLMF